MLDSLFMHIYTVLLYISICLNDVHASQPNSCDALLFSLNMFPNSQLIPERVCVNEYSNFMFLPDYRTGCRVKSLSTNTRPAFFSSLIHFLVQCLATMSHESWHYRFNPLYHTLSPPSSVAFFFPTSASWPHNCHGNMQK